MSRHQEGETILSAYFGKQADPDADSLYILIDLVPEASSG